MLCNKCGKPTAQNQLFCDECKALDPSLSTETTETTEVVLNETPEENVNINQKRKKGLIAVVAAIVVVAIVAGASALLYPTFVKNSSPKGYYEIAQKNTTKINNEVFKKNFDVYGFDVIADLLNSSNKQTLKADFSQTSTGVAEFDEFLQKIAVEGTAAIDTENKQIYSTANVDLASTNIALSMFLNEENLGVKLPFYSAISIADETFVEQYNESMYVDQFGEIPEDFDLKFETLFEKTNGFEEYNDLVEKYSQKIEKLLDEATYTKGEKTAIPERGETLYNTVTIEINTDEVKVILNEAVEDFYAQLKEIYPEEIEISKEDLLAEIEKINFKKINLMYFINDDDQIIGSCFDYVIDVDGQEACASISISNLGIGTDKDDILIKSAITIDGSSVVIQADVDGNSKPIDGKIDSQIKLTYSDPDNQAQADINFSYDKNKTEDNTEVEIVVPDYATRVYLKGSINADVKAKKFSFGLSNVEIKITGETVFDSTVDVQYTVEEATKDDFVNIAEGATDAFELDLEDFSLKAQEYIMEVYQDLATDFPMLAY